MCFPALVVGKPLSHMFRNRGRQILNVGHRRRGACHQLAEPLFGELLGDRCELSVNGVKTCGINGR